MLFRYRHYAHRKCPTSLIDFCHLNTYACNDTKQTIYFTRPDLISRLQYRHRLTYDIYKGIYRQFDMSQLEEVSLHCFRGNMADIFFFFKWCLLF